MGAKKAAKRAARAQLLPDRDNVIGQFVRARRKADGLTQRELAELAGVGARVVWDLERGKPTMRMDAVRSVLAVFGKTIGIVDAVREVEP
jgi:HTH-type transcriptional regulator / antitoxin HipB